MFKSQAAGHDLKRNIKSKLFYGPNVCKLCGLRCESSVALKNHIEAAGHYASSLAAEDEAKSSPFKALRSKKKVNRGNVGGEGKPTNKNSGVINNLQSDNVKSTKKSINIAQSIRQQSKDLVSTKIQSIFRNEPALEKLEFNGGMKKSMPMRVVKIESLLENVAEDGDLDDNDISDAGDSDADCDDNDEIFTVRESVPDNFYYVDEDDEMDDESDQKQQVEPMKSAADGTMEMLKAKLLEKRQSNMLKERHRKNQRQITLEANNYNYDFDFGRLPDVRELKYC